MDILTLFVVVPVLTVFALMMSKGIKQHRVVALAGMAVQTLMSFNLLYRYLQERAAGNNAVMIFTKDIIWFKPMNIHYAIGVDGISVLMILLTSIIVLTGIFISWKVDDLPKEFFISLIVLASGVYGFFISVDLFTMFVFYEIAVIPMYLLIGIWGSGPREYAAMKLTLMLMGASALLLVGLLGVYFNSNADGGPLTFNIFQIAEVNIPESAQKIFFPFLFVGFAVIGALFPFHTWSPDGHASAPTAVSMLHAGVLMKLGGYGIFRVAMYVMPQGAHYWANFFMVLAVIGVFYGALAAIKQKDLKYINAYSSVSHLGLVLLALLMMNEIAWKGAMLQSLSHGFITALFFAMIGVIYGRTHTRIVTKMSGLLNVIPVAGALYVIAGLANLGLPGFSGFVAEMNIFVGAFQHADTFHRVITILAVSSIVVTAVYILRVVGMMLMGPTTPEFKNLPRISWYEKTGTFILVLFITLIGIFPFWWGNIISDSIIPFIQNLN
ncbi:MAG: NADH-quinone oxidoreductase subunit M [Chlorobi bacterium]|nr:NADH-quinone oxidoreductase subunit M [Chlorobiota bacterium]